MTHPALPLALHGGHVPRRPSHSLFIDENGHADVGRDVAHPSNRYLGLTGIACAIAYHDAHLTPALAALKQHHFGSPDVVLHCDDIKWRRKVFRVLEDTGCREAFDADLLDGFAQWNYTAFSVLLDKQELVERFGAPRYNAYHYALEFLLEGYVLWLEEQDRVGDVVAESRGAKENRALEAAFSTLWERGTDYLAPERIQARLSSRQIKIRDKKANMAGLQLCDLLAHPSFVTMRASADGESPRPHTFGQRIVEILEASRYYRVDGCIDGCGRKWLP